MVEQGEPVNAWFKSSYSTSGACVEVSVRVAKILIRDSKDPDGPVLAFPLAAFDEFVRAVKGGEFDLG